MKSIVMTGIIAAIAIAVTIVSFGSTIAAAQMADNATMGNMTGGNITSNMTSGNTTEATGSISSAGVDLGF